jgi:hypothetical protein
MKLLKTVVIYLCCTAILNACNQKEKEKTAPAIEAKPATEPTVIKPSPVATPMQLPGNTITAKFTGFELGDVQHFSFKEVSGKDWDFTDCEEKQYEFAKELPKAKINEANQGYGPNENLLNKTFEITFEKRDGKKLTNGLMDSVYVITKAQQKD